MQRRDLTQGRIAPTLLVFALPILGGNATAPVADVAARPEPDAMGVAVATRDAG